MFWWVVKPTATKEVQQLLRRSRCRGRAERHARKSRRLEVHEMRIDWRNRVVALFALSVVLGAWSDVEA